MPETGAASPPEAPDLNLLSRADFGRRLPRRPGRTLNQSKTTVLLP
jgi:hypothetical protein